MARTSRAEPYIGRTPNLRGRLERLLQPSAKHPRRLHLAGLVRRIEWRLTGSEFESLLAQFSSARRRSTARRPRAHAPSAIRRLSVSSAAIPIRALSVTHRPSLREADWAYGPFPSRAAAERYSEEMLKLFLLRRCTSISRSRPQLSRLRLLRDEDVPRALLQGLHGRALRRKKLPLSKVFSRRAAKAGLSRFARSAIRLRPISPSNRPPRFTRRCSALKPCTRSRAELVRPLSRLRAIILQASANPERSRHLSS